MLVLRDLSNPKQQYFLQGHTNLITCVAVSKSGKYIASGQQTHMGYIADIMIWDVEAKKLLHKMSLHKVKVQELAFSPSDKHLVSLGGEDDNSIIVWDVASGNATFRAAASKGSTGLAYCLAYSNQSDNTFVTAGNSNIRVWRISDQDHKAYPTDCQSGQIKRIVETIVVDEKDDFFYCGTSTGDVLQVQLSSHLLKAHGPVSEKDKFSLGVKSLIVSPDDPSVLFVGAGDGTLASVKVPKFSVTKSIQLEGGVTSLIPHPGGDVLAGTSLSNMYKVDVKSNTATLSSTAHYSPVNDICYPPATDSVFATASDKDIRIWSSQDCLQLQKIEVSGMECKCIVFKQDGSSMISGWSDGRIRAFGPQSGRLQYEIIDAHKGHVTALACTEETNGTFKIVSGGSDGQLRIWQVSKATRTLLSSLKEHKGPISSIRIRDSGLEAVSASADGSCIIWDLNRYVRNQILFSPTFFKSVAYTNGESQLLTCGTDKKVCYWEAFDGSLIRELEASQTGSINSLDVSLDGKSFYIGGDDKLVKKYKYEEGEVEAIGVGHSTEISRVRFAPTGRFVASVSVDGAVMVWKNE